MYLCCLVDSPSLDTADKSSTSTYEDLVFIVRAVEATRCCRMISMLYTVCNSIYDVYVVYL